MTYAAKQWSPLLMLLAGLAFYWWLLESSAQPAPPTFRPPVATEPRPTLATPQDEPEFGPLPDPFLYPAPPVMPGVVVAPLPEPPSEPPPEVRPVRGIPSELQLRGVIFNSQRREALLAGDYYTVGDAIQLNGARSEYFVDQIEPAAVIVRHGSQVWRLEFASSSGIAIARPGNPLLVALPRGTSP